MTVHWEGEAKKDKVRFGGTSFANLKKRLSEALNLSQPPTLAVELDGEYVIPEDDEDMPEQGFSCLYISASGECMPFSIFHKPCHSLLSYQFE